MLKAKPFPDLDTSVKKSNETADRISKVVVYLYVRLDRLKMRKNPKMMDLYRLKPMFY